MRLPRSVLVPLALASTAAWWGCGTSTGGQTMQTSSTGQSTSSGSGSTGGAGGFDPHLDGGPEEDATACTSISAAAHRIPLDIVFLIDRSGSMHGAKWVGTTAALTAFFDDPKHADIGAGLAFFPSLKAPICEFGSYVALDVPINRLLENAFLLTNAIPADATGFGSPTHEAIKGTLMAATAYQDAHPTHKVIVVLATDGDPYLCGGGTIDGIAALAKSARSYNGVTTYVIGVEGATIESLDKIAAGGGTKASYDVTKDINQFAAKVEEIRKAALGCDFEIPPPPSGQALDPDRVNVSYTPKGVGAPKVLLRADDLADCAGKPGWYYDSNDAPTKLVLCPASCATVEADDEAKVSVLFGCKSLIN